MKIDVPRGNSWQILGSQWDFGMPLKPSHGKSRKTVTTSSPTVNLIKLSFQLSPLFYVLFFSFYPTKLCVYMYIIVLLVKQIILHDHTDLLLRISIGNYPVLGIQNEEDQIYFY